MGCAAQEVCNAPQVETLIVRKIERVLCGFGLLLIALGAFQLLTFQVFQAVASPPPGTIPKPLKLPMAHDQTLGQLEIPRLHLSLPILDDDDPASLALSAGHIPGTSVIGSLGNAGIAGHRDTSFRALRNIRVGDRIETHTGQDAVYLVKTVRIVDPADTSLLKESSAPLLTLVTCYPFNYVGSAPRRFVVQAQMTGN